VSVVLGAIAQVPLESVTVELPATVQVWAAAVSTNAADGSITSVASATVSQLKLNGAMGNVGLSASHAPLRRSEHRYCAPRARPPMPWIFGGVSSSQQPNRGHETTELIATPATTIVASATQKLPASPQSPRKPSDQKFRAQAAPANQLDHDPSVDCRKYGDAERRYGFPASVAAGSRSGQQC
jgi:hypothetical protein